MSDCALNRIRPTVLYHRPSIGALPQVVDDVLDFTGSALALGKPALNDLKSGLATAPVLFAAEVRLVDVL